MWHFVITNQLGQLTVTEMQDNAKEIYSILKDEWTLEAICGMLGNAQQESGLNPAQTQKDYPIGGDIGGYGLYQWTPPHNYKNWANENGYDVTDGYYQVIAMNTPIPVGQYIVTDTYPQTFEEFKQVTDIDLATEIFLKNWERAGDAYLEQRKNYARAWYEFLSGEIPEPPSPSEAINRLKNVFYGNKKILYRGKINNFFRK